MQRQSAIRRACEGHSLTASANVVLFALGHLVDEHNDDAVVVLIEDGVSGHHAVARADADVSIGLDSYHVTSSDLRP